MKRSFKLTAAFFTAFIILSSKYNSAKASAAGDKLTIDIGENFSSGYTQVKLPVYIKNIPQNGVSAMNFAIEFDDELILKEITAGDKISNKTDLSYMVKFNKIHILYSDSSGGAYPINSEGVLINLEFSIKSSSIKNDFIVRKVYSDNEIFIDNYLNKLQVNFDDGRVFKKDNFYNVESNKIWRVKFNQELSTSGLVDGMIELKSINGQVIKCDYRVGIDGKTLEILPPREGYIKNNSYTIILKKGILSKYGKALSKDQSINFYINP